jgi:hypothetical protein
LNIQYVLGENHQQFQLLIVDLSGKIISDIQLPAGSGSMQIDVTALTQGMYVVHCAGDGGMIAREKFIKIN